GRSAGLPAPPGRIPPTRLGRYAVDPDLSRVPGTGASDHGEPRGQVGPDRERREQAVVFAAVELPLGDAGRRVGRSEQLRRLEQELVDRQRRAGEVGGDTRGPGYLGQVPEQSVADV